MKRLTDFFGEKDWKTVEIRYNENMKRSKHCCWTVPMSDWNILPKLVMVPEVWTLNRTYERLKPICIPKTILILEMLNRTYERLKLHTGSCNCWTVPTSEQCALYTVINVDEKERKPEQLMSVRQIWIVRVFIFFVVFMHCVLIAKICRYGNRFGDGKCYDRYIKRAWIKIFIVWVFSDSEQIL